MKSERKSSTAQAQEVNKKKGMRENINIKFKSY